MNIGQVANSVVHSATRRGCALMLGYSVGGLIVIAAALMAVRLMK
ncbi:hypothetical protein [Paraburkholderia mimosarum]|nr:hypothetical protein [Paraburkholderia mimosarum]